MYVRRTIGSIIVVIGFFLIILIFSILKTSVNFPWNLTMFIIGCIGAFIMEFARTIRENKSLTEMIPVGNRYIRTPKPNIVAVLITIIYITIGGVLSGILAKTIQEALLYGIFWEAIFTFVIRKEEESK